MRRGSAGRESGGRSGGSGSRQRDPPSCCCWRHAAGQRRLHRRFHAPGCPGSRGSRRCAREGCKGARLEQRRTRERRHRRRPPGAAFARWAAARAGGPARWRHGWRLAAEREAVASSKPEAPLWPTSGCPPPWTALGGRCGGVCTSQKPGWRPCGSALERPLAPAAPCAILHPHAAPYPAIQAVAHWRGGRGRDPCRRRCAALPAAAHACSPSRRRCCELLLMFRQP